MKLEFSRNILNKHQNNKHQGCLSSGNRVVLCGRTDWRIHMTMPVATFLQFCVHAQNGAIGAWIVLQPVKLLER